MYQFEDDHLNKCLASINFEPALIGSAAAYLNLQYPNYPVNECRKALSDKIRGLEEYRERQRRTQLQELFQPPIITSATSLARQLQSSLHISAPSQPRRIRTRRLANQRLALLRASREPLRTRRARPQPLTRTTTPFKLPYVTYRRPRELLVLPSAFRIDNIEPMDTDDEDS